jgi:hypothetical protein
MLPSLTGYGWNPTAHRYVDLESGRFVSQATIRDGLENLIDMSALNMNQLTQQLIDQQITLAAWQSGMMTEIKSAHVAASALSQGGWAQMTQSDWGATGQLIKEQYGYLRNFAEEIASGKQALDGRALVRSDMYGDAANTTYSAMRTRLHIADGFNEEKRNLEDSINACDDCVEYANEGWVPIGTLPEPGNDSQCLKRCRCEKEFRRSEELVTKESE